MLQKKSVDTSIKKAVRENTKIAIVKTDYYIALNKGLVKISTN